MFSHLMPVNLERLKSTDVRMELLNSLPFSMESVNKLSVSRQSRKSQLFRSDWSISAWSNLTLVKIELFKETL